VHSGSNHGARFPSLPLPPCGSASQHCLHKIASRFPRASSWSFRDSKSTALVSVPHQGEPPVKVRKARELTTSGTKAKFKHMKIRYPFHLRLFKRVGVIMTTKKFQIQFAETPTAVPLALTWRGKISGTYTHGMQFAVIPKISMYYRDISTMVMIKGAYLVSLR
jgi:hypothetical protein